MTVTDTAPMLTFVADQDCPAPPEAVYELVASPTLHLGWAGRDTGKHDGLFAIEAEDGVADVGATFTSRGGPTPGGVNEFHDESVVTDARRAEVFAFRTASRLDRGKKPEWHAQFRHRYELTPTAAGTHVHYTCEVRPENYRPYWLHPLMRPVTKRLMNRIVIGPHLDNLARVVAQEGTS